MRPHQWFMLALRVIGTVVSLHGVAYLLDGFLFRLGYFNYPESSFGYYLITGLVHLAGGLYLIWGGPHVVRVAYPDAVDDYEDDDADEGDDEEKTRVSPR